MLHGLVLMYLICTAKITTEKLGNSGQNPKYNEYIYKVRYQNYLGMHCIVLAVLIHQHKSGFEEVEILENDLHTHLMSKQMFVDELGFPVISS